MRCSPLPRDEIPFPPPIADLRTIDIHIQQRSTNRQALVQFTLDPHAAGPGCYTV